MNAPVDHAPGPALAARVPFRDDWRRERSRAFSLRENSTAGRCVDIVFGHTALDRAVRPVYENANFSIYSAQACNARCAFCVEELRPASRGGALTMQKRIEHDDDAYFAALDRALSATAPLAPTISITGGEPSKDARLVRILQTAMRYPSKKRTLTTNGSGLLDVHDGQTLVQHIGEAGIAHLNISRAHPDDVINQRLMHFVNTSDAPSEGVMRDIVAQAKRAGVRVRLSCVLLRDGVQSLSDIVAYVAFARRIGVDNVIFRQLMKTDAQTHADNFVVRYSNKSRVALTPLLDAISAHAAFTFVRQVMGYYYYVEVWRYDGVDVVFEEADLAHLEAQKRRGEQTVHELVFHPCGTLCSTWQPYDGVLLAPPVVRRRLAIYS